MSEKIEKSEIQLRARNEFEQFLANNGHSRTPERFAILNAICDIEGIFNAKMLFDIMHVQKKLPVSLATIYSSLALLEDARIIISHHFDRRTVSYELALMRHGFKYIVCTKCNKVKRVESTMLDKSVDNVKTPRFHVNNYSIYIYGVCASCASLQKRKEKQLLNKSSQTNKASEKKHFPRKPAHSNTK